MSDKPNAGPDYVFPDKPAYGVSETVDYGKLSDAATDEHADGPGFDDESELPESDYPEVGGDDV